MVNHLEILFSHLEAISKIKIEKNLKVDNFMIFQVLSYFTCIAYVKIIQLLLIMITYCQFFARSREMKMNKHSEISNYQAISNY